MTRAPCSWDKERAAENSSASRHPVPSQYLVRYMYVTEPATTKDAKHGASVGWCYSAIRNLGRSDRPIRSRQIKTPVMMGAGEHAIDGSAFGVSRFPMAALWSVCETRAGRREDHDHTQPSAHPTHSEHLNLVGKRVPFRPRCIKVGSLATDQEARRSAPGPPLGFQTTQ